MSGTEFAREKERVAAIMKEKQAKGEIALPFPFPFGWGDVGLERHLVSLWAGEEVWGAGRFLRGMMYMCGALPKREGAINVRGNLMG